MENVIKLTHLAGIIMDELKNIVKDSGFHYRIACLIAGGDPSSLSYIEGMKKKANSAGIHLDIIQKDQDISELEFLTLIRNINENDDYCGLIVQVPLPDQISIEKVEETIHPLKDLDGITPYNQGKLFSGKPCLLPATAWAVDLTLKYIENHYEYSLKGKTASVIGRSITVGKPVFHLLLARNTTPLIVHTRTVEPEKITSQTDIVVASCGVPKLIGKKWIGKNAVVIDVGIHSKMDEDGRYHLCGDVDPADIGDQAKLITAVPGGIGSITSALLMANAVKSYYKIHHNKDLSFHFEENL